MNNKISWPRVSSSMSVLSPASHSILMVFLQPVRLLKCSVCAVGWQSMMLSRLGLPSPPHTPSPLPLVFCYHCCSKLTPSPKQSIKPNILEHGRSQVRMKIHTDHPLLALLAVFILSLSSWRLVRWFLSDLLLPLLFYFTISSFFYIRK